MIALDASIVVAHLHPHDLHHAAATEYLHRSGGEGFTMNSLNLAEVLVGGVKAGRGREMLADLEAIGIQVAAWRAGEPLRLADLRVRAGLKLPDCCALDTALGAATTLATFDQPLAEAARGLGVTVASGE